MKGRGLWRRWWSEWRLRGKIATSPPLSIWEALEQYLPLAELAGIRAATPDRRELVGAVAAVAGVAEAQIVREWCEHRAFDYMERIPLADFSILRAPLTAGLLATCGATLVTEGDTIVRIVCIDPDRIEQIREHLAETPVAVARWGEIRRHLDESVQMADELGAARVRAAADQLRETTEAVIGLIVHEVSDRGLSAVTLDLSGEDPAYAIVAEGREKARGALHAMLRPALQDLLVRDSLEVMMPSGVREPISVARELSGDRFRLTWSGGSGPPVFHRAGSSPSITDSSNSRDEKRSLDGGRGVIFVIDDNLGFSQIVARFLERHGFRVQPFSSAENAWKALEEGTELDLIVCDLHMPGMAGYDFIRRLRATEVGRAVPIVALTSDDDVETEIRLIRAGVSAFVSKSSDPRILCAHVERWCDRGEGRA